MDLYDDYLKMINDAESFMKVHKVRMSGEDIKSGTVALVIPQSLLNEFGKKIKMADRNILEKKIEKTEKIKEVLRKSDNPYDVPEQSSGSDDTVFYFPFGRD
jgi:hypothetical protein